MTNIADMIGRTMVICVRIEREGNDCLYFKDEDNREYFFWHHQECCEDVYIEDISGDLDDIVGSPILDAREDSNSTYEEHKDQQWTFYNFSTIKGSVTVRF